MMANIETPNGFIYPDKGKQGDGSPVSSPLFPVF
jgi:hypothetical protein